MPRMIILGEGGSIDANRVIAVAPFKSKPVKRLLDAVGPARVINLTYGYPRQSVVLLDNGYIAITSRTTGELTRAFDDGGIEEGSNGRKVPWWE